MTSVGDPRPATVPELPVPDPPAGLAAVPAPRPELLVRVLEGLRDLPDAPAVRATARVEAVVPVEGTARTAEDELLPLPRRLA